MYIHIYISLYIYIQLFISIRLFTKQVCLSIFLTQSRIYLLCDGVAPEALLS